MNSYELYFTRNAADAFRKLIEDVQQVSLLSAEKLRSRVFHKLHLIHHHPLQGSKKLELPGVDGEIRLATVLHFKIYFRVEPLRIIVLEVLLDKNVKNV